ncbi:MAG TPA: type I-MYXAN CRISPR-associated protein Cas6/Cmx6 [Thiobacillaceae bacterium]|nr:type I-MYXAN CRISPR-associated protein Cas6/Cmx6 [Thiobacillaceae bacterium]
MSDVHFELLGHALPVDHGWVLYEALSWLAPWIATEDMLGIHPVHGANTGRGELILNRRAKLVIRCPAHRLEDLARLEGQAFIVSGQTLSLGKSRIKPLTMHTPLYAHTVCTGSEDERAFTQDLIRSLDAMSVNTRFICGRPQKFFDGEKITTGYSLMLHGLPIEHAIRVQQQGLGLHRKLGCGIFIPHKSITAVGAMDTP